MYFHGFLIDDSQFFIDEKMAHPCFALISPEINLGGSVYSPEKEGERRSRTPYSRDWERGRKDNYWYIKISRSSFYYSY